MSYVWQCNCRTTGGFSELKASFLLQKASFVV